MVDKVAKYTIDQIELGQKFEFEKTITQSDLDAFAALSGDISPLHMDEGFSRRRGFAGRVAHGMLLGSLLSRLVGVHLPGENALLQSVNVRFLEPVYASQRLRIAAEVEQVSRSTGVVVLKAVIENQETKGIAVRAKLQVGFTQEKEKTA